MSIKSDIEIAIDKILVEKLKVALEERDAYRMAAEQLRAMLDRRWISVEEMLPEDEIEDATSYGLEVHTFGKYGVDSNWRVYGRVLELVDNKHARVEKWYWSDVDGNEIQDEDITHWQPLLPAPEAR